MSLEGKFDNLSADVHEMKDILLRSMSAQSSRQKSLPPLRFKNPPMRVRDAKKTDLQVSIRIYCHLPTNNLQQRTVRAVMNACMGIKRDKDICEITGLPTNDDVDDYDDDPLNAPIQPSLDPMRPSFFSIHSEWNEKLWELLETDSLEDTGYDSAGMKQVFFKRLVQLARIIRESHQRNDETEEQFEERQTGRVAEERKRRQRMHTRRTTVRL